METTREARRQDRAQQMRERESALNESLIFWLRNQGHNVEMNDKNEITKVDGEYRTFSVSEQRQRDRSSFFNGGNGKLAVKVGSYGDKPRRFFEGKSGFDVERIGLAIGALILERAEQKTLDARRAARQEAERDLYQEVEALLKSRNWLGDAQSKISVDRLPYGRGVGFTLQITSIEEAQRVLEALQKA